MDRFVTAALLLAAIAFGALEVWIELSARQSAGIATLEERGRARGLSPPDEDFAPIRGPDADKLDVRPVRSGESAR